MSSRSSHVSTTPLAAILSLAVMAAGVLLPAGTAAAQPEDDRPEWPHVDDHVLVKLATGASGIGREASPIFDRWHRVPVRPGESPQEAVTALAKRPGVEIASLDYVMRVDPIDAKSLDAPESSATPNDPLYRYQWHFPPVQLEEAWDRTSGSGVVVAVLDTGISRDGDDLDCHAFVSPYNAITSTPGVAAAEDDHGHGTHVAGTVAQCTDNGVGVAGVAFEARLMPVKVLDGAGSGSNSTVARGIHWARTRGAHVINLSLGTDCGTATWPACSSPIINDAIEAAAAADILIVAASGNSARPVVDHPANHPRVMAVGAVDYRLQAAPYSNRGPNLDLVAPGGDAARDDNGDGYGDGVLQEAFIAADDASHWGYYFFEGTSMASPHVAGAAALLRSRTPGAAATEVSEALMATALDSGPRGCDPAHGHGVLQIDNALDYITGGDTVAPSFPAGASLQVSEAGGSRVTLTWTPACQDPTLAGYRVYRDGSAVTTVGAEATTASVETDPGGSYRLAVRGIDSAGNLGPALTVAVAAGDTAAPVWPGGSELGVVKYGETELTLGWSAATDNVGVTTYLLRRSGTSGLTSAEREARVTGLAPGTAYTFEVLARDAAGNWSAPLTATVRTALAFFDTRDSVFYQDILWLSGNDITRGCNPPDNTRFCPDDPVTRGQMAAFLTRALDLDASPTDPFTDDNHSVFQADIAALAASGITRGCNPPDNTRFCPDEPVTRGQMAAFLRRALDA